MQVKVSKPKPTSSKPQYSTPTPKTTPSDIGNALKPPVIIRGERT